MRDSMSDVARTNISFSAQLALFRPATRIPTQQHQQPTRLHPRCGARAGGSLPPPPTEAVDERLGGGAVDGDGEQHDACREEEDAVPGGLRDGRLLVHGQGQRQTCNHSHTPTPQQHKTRDISQGRFSRRRKGGWRRLRLLMVSLLLLVAPPASTH